MIYVYLRLAGTTYIHREEFLETPKSLSKLESCIPHHSTWLLQHSALSKALSAFSVVQAKLCLWRRVSTFCLLLSLLFSPVLPVDWLQLLGRKRQDDIRALSVVSLVQRAQCLRWPRVTGHRYSPTRLAWGPFSPAFHLLPFWTLPRAAKTRLLSFHILPRANKPQTTAPTPLSTASPHSWWDWRDTRIQLGLPQVQCCP